MLRRRLVSMLARLARYQIARLKSLRSLRGKSGAHRDESFERFKRRSVIQIHSVTRQFRNRDHQQLVLLAEADEVRHARHRAIIIDDLADHTGGIKSRKTRHVHRSFRLAAALQDAAGPGAKRENMARSREVVRTT